MRDAVDPVVVTGTEGDTRAKSSSFNDLPTTPPAEERREDDDRSFGTHIREAIEILKPEKKDEKSFTRNGKTEHPPTNPSTALPD